MLLLVLVPVVGMLPLDYVTCLCSGEQRAMEQVGGGGEGEVEPGEVEVGGGGEGHCSSRTTSEPRMGGMGH